MTDVGTVPSLSHDALTQAFSGQSFFADKTWRLSPEAFPLKREQVRQIEEIGNACLGYSRALEVLYAKSRQGRSLLRNETLLAPWVAEYLERGKPESLIDHGLHKSVSGQTPFVLRPDLLLTDEGFALTELDAVPGGIGLTAYLNRMFGDGETIVGAGDKMLKAFYTALANHRPDLKLPFIAILVSEEAATYRPEMEWLATELQQEGKRIFVFSPQDVIPLGNSLCVDIGGNPQKIDIIYRFFELFDLPNIPTTGSLQKAVEADHVRVSPPMRHFQEEKLGFGLLQHHRLEGFWRETLGKRNLQVLSKVVPRTWVLDAVDLPPGAVLEGPSVGGKPIHDWGQLVNASQKDRNLILKISGYHETAWGARSVVLGSDCSRTHWGQALHQAIRTGKEQPYILQEYWKPTRVEHPVFDDKGKLYTMTGRVRLCPYFMVQGDSMELTGILATVCPADKKIIHGMKDAILLPCRVES